MSADQVKANATQSERLHHFSHDVRNRINGLHEAAKMMAAPPEGLDPAELNAFLEKQFFGALRCVEDLLDDMRVDRGKVGLELHEADTAAIHQQAFEKVKYRFEQKEQKVIVDFLKELTITTDPGVLARTMQALLSNASKFSKKGSTITVSMQAEEGNWTYQVQDEGVGLTEDDLQKVFQRFTILSSRSTNGEEQGRSSLARAKQWVEAMDGTLKAESPGTGRGSIFTIALPA